MTAHHCDCCEAPATIHETTIENGQPVVHHFCQWHGQELIPKADRATHASEFQAVIDAYSRLSDAEKDELALLHRLTRRSSY